MCIILTREPITKKLLLRHVSTILEPGWLNGDACDTSSLLYWSIWTVLSYANYASQLEMKIEK